MWLGAQLSKFLDYTCSESLWNLAMLDIAENYQHSELHWEKFGLTACEKRRRIQYKKLVISRVLQESFISDEAILE